MVLITGASKGIGKYLFDNFVKSGESVYGTYHSTKPIFSEFLTEVDITKTDDITSWLSKINEKMVNLTLINCAGVSYNEFAHRSDMKEWTKVINVNLVGTFNVIRVLLPIMRDNKFGRIINLSSVVGQMGVPGTSAYAASKSALSGLVKCIAVENAQNGITINNINLGYFDIGIIKEVSEKYQNLIKSKIPTGEFGTPDQIYTAVRFLMDSNYINGSSIDVNGGLF